jgi:transcriptional antiterminator RfaH
VGPRPDGEDAIAAAWYALRSKAREEEALFHHARQRGLTVYYPRLRVRPVNPRARKLVPYFPGYMFILTDLGAQGASLFRWMPHSLGLVSFGDEPASVPNALIVAIQKRVETASDAEETFLKGLRPGDRVWIKDGPLAGYRAIFNTRISGKDRVRVLLELLHHRRVPVELGADLIELAARA